ncbi:riboflavin synthase domain-like protein [Xylariaceae sp. FL1019]|nr:riboflavin synthase domain-like protein [Xylariaceae sp. FL1019]
MAHEQDESDTSSAVLHNGKYADLRDRRMLILYGSESGNSEEAAQDIEDLARRLHFETRLEEMNDVELNDLLQYSLVVFVISTTGQGELPKNARIFWAGQKGRKGQKRRKGLLSSSLPPSCLSQVKFTSFGLGDSSYTQFNWAARKLHKRLETLGAVEFLPRGEADERHQDGIDGTFIPWCSSLRTYLENTFPLPPSVQPIARDTLLASKFTIELMELVPFTVRKDYDVDNNGRRLDREAARFCHVDNTQKTTAFLKLEHELERNSVHGNRLSARASEGTALEVPGSIDTLDRLNVLKDSPDKYSLDVSAAGPDVDQTPDPAVLPIPTSWRAWVRENERLTPESHWQDVRRLVLEIRDQRDPREPLNSELLPFEYRPGETVFLFPKNFAQDVDALITLMGWSDIADRPFVHLCRENLHSEPFYKLPKRCHPLPNSTLRQLLTHNYDFTSIPRRSFFSQIQHYTDNEDHKARLREFGDPGFSDEFWDYTSRPRRSILEVLQDFPSVRIPYQQVPGVFPPIRSRQFSIASSDEMASGDGYTTVELVVALVKYKTVLRKTRQGLCSRYIASLPANTQIVLQHAFHGIPRYFMDIDRPLLLIATGTGIAPIKSLIEERAMNKDHVDRRPQIVLFYGARNEDADFFFEEEWKDYGITVIPAFSRDQPQKIYVQDRILENRELVSEYLTNNALICICGSAGEMPKAVKTALYKVAVKEQLREPDPNAVEAWVRSRHVWEECW